MNQRLQRRALAQIDLLLGLVVEGFAVIDLDSHHLAVSPVDSSPMHMTRSAGARRVRIEHIPICDGHYRHLQNPLGPATDRWCSEFGGGGVEVKALKN